MKLQKFKRDLADTLEKACRRWLDRASPQLRGEKAYAFTLYCSSACTSFGVAASTFESLQRHSGSQTENALQLFVNEMNSAEWEYVNLHSELFSRANKQVDAFYDCLYEGEFEDFKIREDISSSELGSIARETFVDVISQVIQRLKNDGAFKLPWLSEDLLLGLQFGDPGEKGVAMIEQVSQLVNSPSWHEKVQRNCHYIKYGLPSP